MATTEKQEADKECGTAKIPLKRLVIKRKECKIVSDSLFRRITIDYYNHSVDVRNGIYEELDEMFGLTGYRVVRSGPKIESENSARMIIEVDL